jgi:hypothetical protein
MTIADKLWHSIKGYRPDTLEIAAIIGTIGAAWYYLYLYDWSWKAWVMVPCMIVFGYMAGSMVYDLWVPPRRRK